MIRATILIKEMPTTGTNNFNTLALHVDDTTLLVQDVASVKKTVKPFEQFNSASGGYINHETSRACMTHHKRANHWKQGGWVGVESLH
jgi:hypothetical protein